MTLTRSRADDQGSQLKPRLKKGSNPNVVAVLVMAKAPHAGLVKTRLHPLLGPDGCARLQRTLICHATGLANRVAPGAVWVAVDPPTELAAMAELVPSAHLLEQIGDDLGVRLATASAAVLGQAPGPLLVIGTDIPTLTAAHLARAAAALQAGRDVVFGPAVDGGYYLVGMTRPHPEVFALPAARWGGPRVLAESRALAEGAGLRVGVLSRLRDLDTPADAHALLGDPALPPEIAAVLGRASPRTSTLPCDRRR